MTNEIVVDQLSDAELQSIKLFRQDVSDKFNASRKRCVEGLDEARLETLRERLLIIHDYFLPHFVKSDRQALYFQNRYRNASIWIFILAAVSVSTVAAQYIFHLNHFLVIGELMAIVGILFLIHFGKREGWHRNWVDNRLLAEKIRIAMLVDFLCDHPQVEQSRDWSSRWVSDSWCLSHFAKVWKNRPRLPVLTETDQGLLTDFFHHYWLIDQYNFHKNKMVREKAKHKRISLAGEVCFWLTLVAAMLHLAPHSLFHSLDFNYDISMQILTFLAIVLPAFGSALAGLRSHFEFEKLADRSKMMAGHLQQLVEQLVVVDDLAQLEAVVRETELLMSQENADWHITIGFNTLEAPS